MTRQLNTTIENNLEILKSYPKSKKFSENKVFPKSILPIIEKTCRNIVWGVGDTNNEMLDDINLFSDLLYILNNGKNDGVRYFVANLVRQLFTTTNEKQITNQLINALIEKDINDIRVKALLYAIPKNSEGLHRLGRFLNSDNRNIRSDALDAIAKSKSDEVRPLIEKVLSRSLTSGSKDFLVAIIAIGKFGNDDSINIIKPYLHDKNVDSQVFALGAIASIKKEKGSDIYIKALLDKRFRSKHNALLQIKEYCGKEGLEAVIKRLKVILSGDRLSVACQSDGRTELTDGIDYISSFNQEKQVIAFYKYIVKKLNKLSDNELRYLKDNNTMFYKVISQEIDTNALDHQD